MESSKTRITTLPTCDTSTDERHGAAALRAREFVGLDASFEDHVKGTFGRSPHF